MPLGLTSRMIAELKWKSLLGLRIKENMEKHHLQSTDFRVANVVLLMSIIVT